MADQLNIADAPSWSDWLTNFDAAYDQFNQNYQGLINIGSWVQINAPEKLSEYQSLLSEASNVAAQLDNLKTDRDTIASWLNTYGQAFVDAPPGSFAMSGFSGLGASLIWTIGTSLVGAFTVLAAMQQTITKISSWLQNIAAYVTARSQGVAPSEAQAVADHISPVDTSTGFLPTGPSLQTIIAIGILIWIAPSIINAFFGGKRT